MGTLDCFSMFNYSLKLGGGKRDRTADLLHAMQALSQLSYTPVSGTQHHNTLLLLLTASFSQRWHC
jgi:hypothetical protein